MVQRPTEPAPSLHERLPATSTSVAAARTAVKRFVRGLDVDADDVVLAVSEAVANVVRHAYPGNSRGVVELTGRAGPTDVTLEIRDHGQGLDGDRPTGGAGFGLPIIRRLAARVELRDTGDGVTLTMAFRRGAR
jgi:anti-sigma regulatory factor (Ser/Thr protein kinase)